MSEDMQEQSTENGSAPKGGKKLLVIALTIGLVAGAAAGSLVVGPLVAEGPKKEASDAEGSDAPAADCSALLAAHGVQLAPAAVHTIDNVVVNPAQSGGTRFLMASVAFGLSSALGADEMALRDAEVRDIVVRILSSRNVSELTDLSIRSAIKDEMRDEVVALIGEHALVDIYFPQFVIQ